MAEIKMVDLHSQYLRIKDEVDQAIQGVLDSTAFIQGPDVSRFAENICRYVGAEAVVTCANGTDALQISMMALGLKPGDEVILPVHTYVAAAEVIALLGLTPVFADVDRNTFNINVSDLPGKITKATRAIVPVHLYGQCADMEPVLKIAKDHNLYVIEDAAQALGAVYTFSDGRRKFAGTMSTVGTTSFFPSKNLGCYGDGGAVFTNDKALGERIRMTANHGQRVKYKHEVVGVNSRLDTLQAAILDVKLKYLDEYSKRRNDVASFYDKALTGLEGVEIPFRSSNSSHVFHQYTLKVERRDELKDYLSHRGIPTMIYYPTPLHFQPAYARHGFGPGSFPAAEKLSKKIISLPIHTEVPPAQLDFICQTIKAFYK